MALSQNLMPFSYFQGGIQAHRRPYAGTLKTAHRLFRGAMVMTVDGVAQNVVSGASMAALCLFNAGGDANSGLYFSARRPNVRVALTSGAAESINIVFGATVDITVTYNNGVSTPLTVCNLIRGNATADRLLRCKHQGTGAGVLIVALLLAAGAVPHIELLGVVDREMDNSDGVAPLQLLPSDVFAIGTYGVSGAGGGNAPAERSMSHIADENTVTKVADPLSLRAPVARIVNGQTYIDLMAAE